MILSLNGIMCAFDMKLWKPSPALVGGLGEEAHPYEAQLLAQAVVCIFWSLVHPDLPPRYL